MAGLELVEVGLGDLLEGEPQGGGESGEVPEDVAELLGEPCPVEAALVEEGLLDDLLDLAGLAAEADRGHGELFPERESSLQGAFCLGLVGGEVHQAAPPRASRASRFCRSDLVSQSEAGQTPSFSRATR